jgi:thiopeptide-type bacteriocin biosynthesis protein
VSSTWTYWKVYAPPTEVDRLVLTLRQLVERVAGAATDWHFLRYADHSGPHLRFRAFTAPSIADALHAMRHQLGHPVRPDLYEPEVEKWGSTGVVGAERVFAASTLLAAQAIEQRTDISDRVLRRTVAVLVPDERSRRSVLRTHAAWWMGERDPDGGGVERALSALRDEPPSGAQDREAGSDEFLQRFVDDLAAAMRTAGPEHPPTYHLHQHLHLTMNRLGLDPHREAAVALRELVRLERTGVTER